MERQVIKTQNGFEVRERPEHTEKKNRSKGGNQNDRIEAKLDLIMEHLKIKL